MVCFHLNQTLVKTSLIYNICKSGCLGMEVEVGIDWERAQGSLFGNFLHYDLSGGYMSEEIDQNTLHHTLECVYLLHVNCASNKIDFKTLVTGINKMMIMWFRATSLCCK